MSTETKFFSKITISEILVGLFIERTINKLVFNMLHSDIWSDSAKTPNGGVMAHKSQYITNIMVRMANSNMVRITGQGHVWQKIKIKYNKTVICICDSKTY